jgi:hypothetical protein
LVAKGVDVNDTRWHGATVTRKTRV